jgi:ATP-dependent Clp protease ATP-binding subunit ClpA
MYERFTDRARKVMQLANQEAQRFYHEYIGTEHILLGLIKEGGGVAANVLGNLGVDLRKIRLEVEKLMQSGPEMVMMSKLPQTPRAKKAIEYAMEEARNLNHTYIGTEHVLLGLVRENEGVAAQVLMNLGLNVDDVRNEVLRYLGQDGISVVSLETDGSDHEPGSVKTDHDGTAGIVEPVLDADEVLSGLYVDAGGEQGANLRPLLRLLTSRNGDIRKIIVFLLRLVVERRRLPLESDDVIRNLLVSAGQSQDKLPDLLTILSEEGWVRTAIVDVLHSYYERQIDATEAVEPQNPGPSY